MTAAERTILRRLIDEARRQQTLTGPCLYCGAEFIPNKFKPSQRFCRTTCRVSYSRGYRSRAVTLA